MAKKKAEEYSDFSNVVDQNRFLAAEEFPEGSYGELGNNKENEPVTNKDTPWEEGQSFISNYAYESRAFHENQPREYPEAHQTHDNPKRETETPFEDVDPDTP
ncbi:hypothetical protein EV207_16714 [Scopulibacillus darangshiensis]|uniref:Cytosolic protein n=1 Tax=Scopulibacillus darangshiensis TaxID=442528 RepID=A0A4V2SKD8_9BACL|nr:hypothetical protein [Scopulibacillus darangshiensis]TCP19136.1 hypothetical protein EV207_16714 [Scopulibacillus darangshiensis]